ncbi:glycoside hydrolase family 5 protein [Baudoinia panamericana UAMH 10762]|uniref:glucan 1,3-beta-glucosidase n=1 Tax=Baudoinia panamericana (strain UAMH 10762) TaxID=717646 RepID=M2NKJ2_BAUPA|nr:glycoside hydrolase family 5 protein [Baudoinia panamericana UAMH 10762]EMC99650.1 glycoside hydrolase family 5 protein [Baudoinia panamericana UAMH 10762]
MEAEVSASRSDDLVYNRDKLPRRERQRIVSGQKLEHGSQTYFSEKEKWRDDVRRRNGGSSDLEYDESLRKRKRWRNICIGVGAFVLVLAIAIPVGIVLSKKNDTGGGGGASTNSTQPGNSNLNGMSENDIPKQYQGTYLDPFSWYDTTDFNVTFTSEMVGDLPLMGLNNTWDDSKSANNNTPPLNQAWQYGTMPVHGVNLGGWLSIEPVLTPSLFSGYTTHDNVIDEYTLTQTLGAPRAKSMLEKHYSSFVTEQTFIDIQAAGFDHIRIPFSYWAVVTYDADPYVANVSFRYLLRGIEWARKYGLRINLDLHGAPGSQNGWNHSGRQGVIGWLNGTNGQLNGDRTIAIHNQLSTFFTQPRYKNIIAMYGLVNEPRMVELDVSTVLNWTTHAISTVRSNNYTGVIVFGDGFLGLDNWQGRLQNQPNLLLDVHQYVIFNVQQIVLNHHDKINFACGGWTQQALRSTNKATGFGPTLCGEWSQADTDCAQYLNNVGIGSRWEGTLNMADTPGGSSNGSVLSPTCPTQNNPQCSCKNANAGPSAWSQQYKQWLLMFAEAQMHSFEQGWGWFYWTWQTESAYQWSYKAGLAAGVLPALAYQRDFNCSQTIPDFASLGLPEYY